MARTRTTDIDPERPRRDRSGPQVLAQFERSLERHLAWHHALARHIRASGVPELLDRALAELAARTGFPPYSPDYGQSVGSDGRSGSPR